MTKIMEIEQAARNARDFAIDYCYAIIDKIFTLTIGELAISISFTTIKNDLSSFEIKLICILWTLFFLTALLSMILFWSRYKNQMKFSEKIYNSKLGEQVSQEDIVFSYLRIPITLLFTISNFLLLLIGISLIGGINLERLFYKMFNVFSKIICWLPFLEC